MKTDKQSLLSILITTYNRSEYVDRILEILSDYQKRGLVFDVIVSDDCSTDDTEIICSKWQGHLEKYKYVRLASNGGMDRNFISAYSACETEYCWLLGDHRYVEFEELQNVLSILEQRKYDALVLNCHPRNRLRERSYTEINELLLDLGYNITNNASCVIPKSFFSEWAYRRYCGTTFLHMGIFVENLCFLRTFCVLYMSDVKVKDIQLPKPFWQTGWVAHPFLNFGKLWFQFVMSLPNMISVENKFKILLSHNEMTGIFDLHNVLLNKKMFGDVYKNCYKENRKYMRYVSSIPRWHYDLRILIFPSLCFEVWDVVRQYTSLLSNVIKVKLKYGK